MAKLLHRSLEAKLAALNGPEWASSDEDEESMSTSSMEEETDNRDNKRRPDTESDNENNNSDDENSQDKPTKKHKKDDEGNTNPNDKYLSNASTTKPPQNRSRSSSYKGGNPEDPTSIIYLGRLPKGFEETEIHGFLNQFGTVRRVKLVRSKRTHGSRGFAFIQFDEKDDGVEVAKIVADTLSGYFVKDKRMVCRVLKQKETSHNMFRTSLDYRKEVDFEAVRLAKVKADQEKFQDVEKVKKWGKKRMTKEKLRREKLAELGIDYEFPSFPTRLETESEKKGKEKEKESKETDEAKDVSSDDDSVGETTAKKSKKTKDESNKSEKTKTSSPKEETQSKEKKTKKERMKRRSSATKQQIEDILAQETKDDADVGAEVSPNKLTLKEDQPCSQKKQKREKKKDTDGEGHTDSESPSSSKKEKKRKNKKKKKSPKK